MAPQQRIDQRAGLRSSPYDAPALAGGGRPARSVAAKSAIGWLRCRATTGS
jgi:hypothetical protein